MSDLIERLRFGGNHNSEATRHKAADRIEALEAALREIVRDHHDIQAIATRDMEIARAVLDEGQDK